MKKHNRVAAIVGAYGSGKTSLLESILYTTGAILSKGGLSELTRFSDTMELNHDLKESVTISSVIANTTFLEEDWTFIDCPGHQEFMQDTYNVLMICDVAIVVCEPDPKKAIYVHHVMKFLEDHKIPRIIFINKIDTLKAPIKEVLNALQDNSEAMLALREIPMQDRDGDVVGFVDLISERAYRYGKAEYKDNKSLHLPTVPEEVKGKKEVLRDSLVENLSEYNDTLLEMLLEDKKPTLENIYEALKTGMNTSEVVPVFFGIAENDEGIFRLLKALRHDAGGIEEFSQRHNIANKESFLKIFKISYNSEVGTIYYARVLDHDIKENKKIGTFYSVNGAVMNKIDNAVKGDVIAITSKLGLKIGAIYDDRGTISNESFVTPIGVMQAVMIKGYNINEEPLLLKALESVKNADISTKFDYVKQSDTYFLWGQGEQHIKCIISMIKKVTGLSLTVFPAKFPMKKTVAKTINSKVDHTQKDNAGHIETAEFDYVITPNGTDEINVIIEANLPKEIKKAIVEGFSEFALNSGVVGMNIKIPSASYNETEGTTAVFKTASRKAMSSIASFCTKELDSGIKIDVTLLNDSLGALEKLIADRNGKTINYIPKQNWKGFTVVSAIIPKLELYNFRNELQTISSGIGYFKIRT